MRGKVCPGLFGYHSDGITPACAGKRLYEPLRAVTIWDHPRVCGEKAPRHLAHLAMLGSPPRVRGKGKKGLKKSPRYGITPACAGKSTAEPRLRITTGDHPRVCGEKPWKSHRHNTQGGSPPRVRGKVFRSAGAAFRAGITPACAGKRLKRSHSIGHFSCILCLFHSVLHRASVSGGSRAGPCAPPCLPAQNAVPV